MHDGSAPDHLLVGPAVLGLLSEVAEERPLLCVVDDAQWRDHASMQTATFAARRLEAESVAMVVAVCEPGEVVELAGLPDWSRACRMEMRGRAGLGALLVLGERPVHPSDQSGQGGGWGATRGPETGDSRDWPAY